MDASRQGAWAAAISESSRASIAKLARIVDFANPPDFYAFVCEQWEGRSGKGTSSWDVIQESQILLRAVGDPALLSREQALRLFAFAMAADPLFDAKLLRRLLGQGAWPEEVPADQVMRTLEALETLEGVQRLSMTLLKFSRYPDPRIQSKVAKILGRCVESPDVMEDLFENPDGRVRANLIEGLLRRKSLERFLGLLERAARDPHPRVSSLALAIRAQQGHGGANALVKMRTNSKMDNVRKSAEFARKIAAGEAARNQPPPAGGSLLDGGLRPEPAVAAAIEEVDAEAQGHPQEEAEPVLQAESVH
jgi:hypothetical protein